MVSGPARLRRTRIAVGLVLAVGWSAALAVWLTVAPVEQDAAISDMEQSKAYVHRVELIGGRAALEGAAFTDWVASLFEGRRLAYPIAGLTALAALVVWAWLRGPPADREGAP